MKKTSVLLFCLLIASLSGIAGAHTIIEGPTGTSLTGETNTYSLSIADVDAIEGVFLKILFDPVFVSIEGIRANGSFSGSDVTVNINNNDGWARILLISPEGISIPNDDPVPVIDLDFCTQGNTGTIPLTLVDATYSKDFFPYDFDLTEAGSLTINPAPISPEASFSADSVEGAVPFDVTFTDTSTNTPTSWSWDFGDGSNSTVRNPVHEYTTAGNFTVSLVAANDGGSDTEIRTDYILVSPVGPPDADFTSNATSGNVPLPVLFTDESTNIPTSWSWDFGDGSNSTAKNPVHEYTTAGNFTVTLVATNSGGSDTVIRTDYIIVSPAATPDADFIANVTSGSVPLTVLFTDVSTNTPTSWSWDFGDGSSSPVRNPQHTYVSAGNYTVRLTVHNAEGTDSKTRTEYIKPVSITMPTANFTADITSGTAPLAVDFTDLSTDGTYWAWYFGDGSTSNAPNPYPHTYASPGTYDVRLVVTNSNGTSTALMSSYITVYPAEVPVVPVEAAPPGSPGSIPSIPKVDQPVSPAIGPVTDVPVNPLAASVPEFSPGESSATGGLPLAAAVDGDGVPDSGTEGSSGTSAQPAIPLPDAGDMPIPLTFHTMLTSCGAISGTAIFRKFGDKQEFDKMVSYLLKATGLISASIAFWLFSTIFF